MRSSHLASLALAAASLIVSASAAAKPWKGAEMVSQQTFKYGAFEARLVAARGGGIITPFFLYKNGSEVPGAEWEEMDFEIFGRDNVTSFQSQIMTPGDPRTEHVELHQEPFSLANGYHTYRMEWTPTRLSFYFDGTLIRQETDTDEYAKLMLDDRAEPMTLRVSVWAGDSEWSGAFDSTAVPAHVFVSYVRYEQYTPGSGPSGSDFTEAWQDNFASYDGSRWYGANWTFDAAINDYVPDNSTVRDGYLTNSFTDEQNLGYSGPIPIDPDR
ncbi:MAG TPA: family 16 glycosylhydrolase [Polyangiaceae bacterium]